MTITQSEVDSNAQLNFTATKDVLKECVSFVEYKVFETCGLVLAAPHQVELQLALFELCDVARKEAQINVLSALLRLEEFHPNFSLWVLVRKF